MADTQQEQKEEKTFELLPHNVIPSHYAIELEPDLVKFTFSGKVSIVVDVREGTQNIVLNAAELKMHNATFTSDADKVELTAQHISHDEATDQVTLQFEQMLHKHKGTLNITFDGILNDQLRGFYRSTYKVGEEERILGTTQMEAVDARRAFPCWDEPALKATFGVTLIVPSDRTAISNMPEVAIEELGNGKKKVQFADSPVMSTYLLAWAVGEFECISETIPKSKGGTTLVRVFTVPGKVDQAKFALSVAVRVLPFFEKYYDIDYPLPKSDLLAVPDFSAGAMENWGLVTYRDTCIFCDENSGAAKRQRVATTVAHELAHQWFGNLVTMSWWKELWLNEGFACFMQYLATDHLYPEWQLWTSFIGDDFASALGKDALESSHAIEVEVYRAAEVDEIFDEISYSKGASVIRMLESYLGEESFRAGLTSYLNAYAYKNARTVDLWEALADKSCKPVTEIMSNWTAKQGYPVLIVSEGEKMNTLTVRQERFLSGGKATEEQDQVVWEVPLLVRTNGSVPFPVLLSEKTSTFEIPPGASWVKLNANQTAVCRVKYTNAQLKALSEAIRSGQLPPGDRLGLVGDAYALAKAGHATTVELFQLLQNFGKEQSVEVLREVTASVRGVADLVAEDKELRASVDQFTIKLLKEKADAVGWDAKQGEEDLQKLLRQSLVGALCSAKEPSYVQEARKRFDEYVKGNKSVVNDDLRTCVFETSLRNGDASTWESVKALGMTSDDSAERVDALRSLGATADADSQAASLNLMRPESGIRKQDAYMPYTSVSRNKSANGHTAAIQFLKDNFELCVDQMPYMIFSSVLAFAGGRLTKAADIDAYEQWWETVPEETRVRSRRSFQQGVESSRNNARWLERDGAELKAWLGANL